MRECRNHNRELWGEGQLSASVAKLPRPPVAMGKKGKPLKQKGKTGSTGGTVDGCEMNFVQPSTVFQSANPSISGALQARAMSCRSAAMRSSTSGLAQGPAFFFPNLGMLAKQTSHVVFCSPTTKTEQSQTQVSKDMGKTRKMHAKDSELIVCHERY